MASNSISTPACRIGTIPDLFHSGAISESHRNSADQTYAPSLAKGCKISTSNITQLHVARRVTRDIEDVTDDLSDHVMVDKGHILAPLIRNMSSIALTKYVEQWLEQKLGIRDQSVDGEAPL